METATAGVAKPAETAQWHRGFDCATVAQMQLHEEVRAALEDKQPVVALESSIVAQGLPSPTNLEVAHEMSAAVRQSGAVPAMVAVVGGVVRVGLDDGELDLLVRPGVVKAGARDLAACAAFKQTAGTTVSATAWVAAKVGIRLFATGGIGGVHRGDDADVSSDIGVLASAPVGVVSSGAKLILDLRRTLEALETAGVAVVGYRTDAFPAFYCRESGYTLPHSVAEPSAAAELLWHRFETFGQGGVLLCHPVPEGAALERGPLEQLVADACERAAKEGVSGAALTPYLLDALSKKSGGETLAANRALAVANSTAAAEIAVSLAARYR